MTVGDGDVGAGQKVLLVVLAGGLTLFLAVHFSITALFVGPVNPIRLAWDDEITGYMTPYFEQNWSLFAPNPISEERGMLVRARLGTDEGPVRTTPFVDITNPAIRAVQSNRLFPSRFARLVSSGIQMLSWEDPVIQRYREKLRERPLDEEDGAPQQRPAGATPGEPSADGPRTVEPPITPAEQRYRDRTDRFLQALATAEAVRRWGPAVLEVQVRLVRHEFPRFSQRRSQETGPVTYEDLAWARAVTVAR